MMFIQVYCKGESCSGNTCTYIRDINKLTINGNNNDNNNINNKDNDNDCKCIECNIPNDSLNNLPLHIGVSFEIRNQGKHFGIELVKINA